MIARTRQLVPKLRPDQGSHCRAAAVTARLPHGRFIGSQHGALLVVIHLSILLISGVASAPTRTCHGPTPGLLERPVCLAEPDSSLIARPASTRGPRPARAAISGTIARRRELVSATGSTRPISRGRHGLAVLSAATLNQAVIVGEIIRSHDWRPRSARHAGPRPPAYCASACVLVYPAASPVWHPASSWAMHRFVTTAACDPVADTQRIAGFVLGYMTKMGVSSAVWRRCRKPERALGSMPRKPRR